jgi:hypothetical protein
MRATEFLTEAVKPTQTDKLITLVSTPTGTWYETDVETLANHFRQINGSDNNVDRSPGVRYFVFAPKGFKTLSLASRVMMLKDQDLSGGTYVASKQDAEDLQALADVTQAQHGTRVYGDFILYKGKVYIKYKFLSSLPVVAQIQTGSVHEVPSDALWTLNRLHLKYQTSAQRVVVFPNTTTGVSEPWSSASIRDGKISDIQSQRKLDKITQVQLGKEVAQTLGLTQKITVNTHIIPESKLHDTLRAINDHPGVNRAQLYWTVLKLKKLPPYLSKEDVAAELVKLGLVKEDERELMSLSPIGKLVLARVNSGKSVAKASLIK